MTPRGGGYYALHPALRWFFKDLFDRYYAGSELAASRAFVEAMGELASFYHQQVEEGNRKAIAGLAAEEANLLLARRLARRHGWWGCVISAMQGLDQLYDHRGRRGEWRRLVEEIVPEFVDPSSEQPLPEREQEDWSLVMQYRVHLAQEDRDWVEAERLQLIVAQSDRERAQPALDLPPEELSEEQRNAIRTLAVSLERLGHVCREQERDECAARFEEALELADRIGDRVEAAICAFNLGTSRMIVPGIRDLDRAEHWYRPDSLRRLDPSGRKSAGKLHDAAETRFNVAFDLAHAGRLQDALGYARSALRGFEARAPAAAPDFEQTRQLMEQIQTTMAEPG